MRRRVAFLTSNLQGQAGRIQRESRRTLMSDGLVIYIPMIEFDYISHRGFHRNQRNI